MPNSPPWFRSRAAPTPTLCTFGELIAWIIGWSIMLEYLFSASLVAIGWSGYATALLADLGVHLPACSQVRRSRRRRPARRRHRPAGSTCRPY